MPGEERTFVWFVPYLSKKLPSATSWNAEVWLNSPLVFYFLLSHWASLHLPASQLHIFMLSLIVGKLSLECLFLSTISAVAAKSFSSLLGWVSTCMLVARFIYPVTPTQTNIWWMVYPGGNVKFVTSPKVNMPQRPELISVGRNTHRIVHLLSIHGILRLAT